MENPGAALLLGRKALPDIKDTIYRDITEMLTCEQLEEGRDYKTVDTRGQVYFRNGSKIFARSWSDRKYKKLGSLKISAAIIEELAENDDEDEKAYDFILMRVGRLPNVPHKWVMSLTNPDEPDHWAYKRLISKPTQYRRIYKSKLRDNPYLDEHYEARLRETLDPMLAKRMVDGEWISIKGKSIYRSYTQAEHYKTTPYIVDPRMDIRLSFDFNVAENKPMSAIAAQYSIDHFHFFREFVVHGIDTQQLMEEIAATGFLNQECRQFTINGDATGKSRSSKSLKSDYDFIREFLTAYRRPDGKGLTFHLDIPTINPPIKTRHNQVNAYLKNSNGKVRVTVYNCPVADEGFRLTKLKKGADYIEDDSKPYQHVCCSAGYLICAATRAIENQFDILGRWGDTAWR
jgi:hypothetical protein